MSQEFNSLIGDASPEVRSIAKRAEALIRRILPDAVELVWPKQAIASYGIGPKKMSEHFCYLGLFKKHVNLGFYYGSDLKDPAGLLQGTGKAMRHIKISDAKQLADPALKTLLTAASKHYPKLNTSN